MQKFLFNQTFKSDNSDFSSVRVENSESASLWPYVCQHFFIRDRIKNLLYPRSLSPIYLKKNLFNLSQKLKFLISKFQGEFALIFKIVFVYSTMIKS